jgi:hypothetical protein
VRGWIAELPRRAARVRIPVHYALGQDERVWNSDAAAIADVAGMFTASPRVVTLSPADASHNLSVGWTALSCHLKILSFAEECAIVASAVIPRSRHCHYRGTAVHPAVTPGGLTWATLPLSSHCCSFASSSASR